MIRLTRRWLVTILVAVGTVLVMAIGASAASTTTLRAVVDGSVIDSDLDGRGDFTYDGLGSVIVGFNAHFGPGEYRGLYDFDLGDVPACGNVVARLRLSLGGTFADAGDPNLTLFAAIGDGALTPEDFDMGSLAASFSANEPATYPISVVDVSMAVRSARVADAPHLAFALRPNPLSAAVRGAFLFSSNEITDVYGFVPTVLEIECSGPLISVPADVTVNATEPSGATVIYTATASDATGNVPVSCSPVSGSLFAIGATVVTCSATDSEGDSASAHFTVDVHGAAAQIGDLREAVAAFGGSIAASLDPKLADALAGVSAGKVRKACGAIGDFASGVRAQAGKKLPAALADAWHDDAARIQGVLAC